MKFSICTVFSRVVLGFLMVVACSSIANAQANSPYRQLNTAKNLQVADTISGVNLGLSVVNPLAQHGHLSISIITPGGGSNPYVYRVVYTPDPGFMGTDTFAIEYNYYGSYPYLTYRGFRVSVYPSSLLLKEDYSTTTTGTPVLVNVLANDHSSEGGLVLTEVPGATHGTATLSGGQVLFTPEAGYTGPASFNYTVCDAIGHCKTGYATVGIHATAIPYNDSLQVFTAKNTTLSFPLLHSGYSMFQAPAHGVVAIPGGQSFCYTPDYNFSGDDQFILVNNNYAAPVYKTIKVSTFHTPAQNLMAIEDNVFTPKNRPITFNVRHNDIGNLLVKGWIVPNSLPGTISATTSGGNVTFTPNPGFKGVATFYYKLGNSNIPDLEIGTINVLVGNLPPSAGVFELTTPKNTPLVIDYKLPFNGFQFTVTDAPAHGTCSYYPGFSTQTYAGQTVSGYNLLVYTPSQGYVGADEFEVNYCIPFNGDCESIKVVVNTTQILSTTGPYCISSDCVWAGDANNDGIVNNKDLLPIGYFMGTEGLTRPGASLEWYGQFGTDWNNPYTSLPLDLKHSDTDGSGLVETADTLSIGLFYGQTSKLTPHTPATSKGLPFFLEFLTPPDPQPGDLVEVEVSLGNADYPVTNLYGFTFDVTLSPLLVDSAFNMTFYDHSWLNSNAPYLTLDKRPRQGRLETAFTRTNGLSASGQGKIGKFEFIIIDVIQGVRPESANQVIDPFLITIEGNTLNGEGQTSPIYTGEISMPVKSRTAPNTTRTDLAENLRIYPSPASDQLQLHLNGSDLMEEVLITDLTGKLLWRSADQLHTEHTQVDLSGFPNGLYVAVARTQNGQIVRKFEVLK